MKDAVHKFTLAGLGEAPFRCVGMFSLPSKALLEANPEAYNAAMRAMPAGYGCGTCDYCGMALTNNYLIKSADGKKFVVGCECVLKVGDAGMTTMVKVLRNKMNREKAAAKREAARVAKLDAERKANGGFTNSTWDWAHREHKTWLREEAMKPILAKLAPIASRLDDGKGGFRQSVACDLRDGRLPVGRGMTIMLEILAKDAGRKGSADYKLELAVMTAVFCEVEKMLEEVRKC